MNWQIGDLAIAQNCLKAVELNGQECEILGYLTDHSEGAKYVVVVDGFPSKHPDGAWAFKEKHLKPFPDDNETTSWEAVEKITGWQPKIPETVHG